MSALCRSCAAAMPDAHCSACGGDDRIAHPELANLHLAHLDCDAFYASIEKRDRPEIASRPVIVGGGQRGVVATACYIARAYGVRSAMPAFKALQLCPEAVVIRPDMAKYVAEGKAVRARMMALTPLVEPISIDEAFLDLSGLERLHGASPAQMLLRLQAEIAAEQGLTVSIGLSFNKFLAKTASDLDKPKGFSIIGRAEALDFLGPRPVGTLPGVGAAGVKALEAFGARTIADLRRIGAAALARKFGPWGLRLFQLAHGEDDRAVDPEGERKSLSAETTFNQDLGALGALEDRLWPLCEKVAARARASGFAGAVVTLKLKDSRFRIVTRRRSLSEPTLLAARLFEAARALLTAEVDGRRQYRLIGVALTDLSPAADADKGDLIDARTPKRAAAEAAVAATRARFGAEAVQTGRGLKGRGLKGKRGE